MRKTMILAMAVVAVMAGWTSAAYADVGVEVRDAVSGELCDDQNNNQNAHGGCDAGHWTGHVSFYQGNPGVYPMFSCQVDLDITMFADGSFTSYNPDLLSPCGTGHDRNACYAPGSGTIPWTGQVSALGNGEFEAVLNFCTNIYTGPGHQNIPWSSVNDLELDANGLPAELSWVSTPFPYSIYPSNVKVNLYDSYGDRLAVVNEVEL